MDQQQVLYSLAQSLREQIGQIATVPAMSERAEVMRGWLKDTEEMLKALGATPPQ